MAPNELDCAVYVEAPDPEALYDALIEATGGRREQSTIEAAGVELYVDDNDEADAARGSEFPDGFLFFTNRVEVYPESPRAAALVTELLEALWARGWPAVAACDYEDELPRNGGYKAPDVPWPGR